MSFENKTVLITGGASGIGLLSGINFAKEGAAVVLCDINEAGLKDAEKEIRAISEKVLICRVDARNYDEVCAARDAAVKTFGSIDVLVCAAGGAEMRLLNRTEEFKDLPIEVLDYSIDLNLKGALYFDHAVLSQMAKQNSGVIINFGSITGEEGCSSNIGYSASKSALMNGVVKSLAKYGAKYNIRACCIAPGPVLTRAAMANMKTLLGYAAETQEIVDMILYLSSDKARSITGSTYFIDGGRNAMGRA